MSSVFENDAGQSCAITACKFNWFTTSEFRPCLVIIVLVLDHFWSLLGRVGIREENCNGIIWVFIVCDKHSICHSFGNFDVIVLLLFGVFTFTDTFTIEVEEIKIDLVFLFFFLLFNQIVHCFLLVWR